MQTVDEFRTLYSRSSDSELAKLVAAGTEGLRPEAWQALTEELQRRRLPTYASPYTNRVATSPLTGTGRYPKAPVGPRFLAYLIDLAVSAVPVIAAAGYAFTTMGRGEGIDTAAVTFVVTSVLWALYYAFAKDGFEGGQSFGKRAVDLMVVNVATNRPCSLGESFVRGIIQTLLSTIPIIGWFVEPIAVLVNDDGRRLGDRAAGTQVIETRLYERSIV